MDEDTPYGHDRTGETQRPNSMDAGTCMAHTWGSHTCGSCGSHASVLHDEEGSEGRKNATLVAKDTKNNSDLMKIISRSTSQNVSLYI